MVMSMDAASDTQTIGAGSPMDDSSPVAAAARHQQESADEDLNEDEESKASGQTIVASQQQKNPTAGPFLPTSSSQQKQHQQSVSMVQSNLSKASEDQQQLRMSVDYEGGEEVEQEEKEGHDEVPQEKRPQLRPKVMPAPIDDISQDSLVARMRDIVEGGQHNLNQQQQQKPEPNDGSSGESLNNQTETNSKASVDSAQQQKRTRHAKSHLCARHGGFHHHHHRHHHHHHHQQHQHRRQSIGTISSQASKQASGAPSRHNHNHHHHHHQSVGTVSGNESRRSSQQITPKQDLISGVHEASAAQARAGELKSSTSSVSSNQPRHQQPDKTSTTKEDERADAKIERCERHDGHHHHHHHHHTDREHSHPRHNHHYHAHVRHQRHRSHKKRLVQETGDDQAVNGSGANGDQLDQSVDSMIAPGSTCRKDASSSNDSRPELEQMGQASSSKDSSREPLKDVTGGHSNCCPYHEHHHHHHLHHSGRANHQQKGHHHHHHHHHHHQHLQHHHQHHAHAGQLVDMAKTSAEQDSAAAQDEHHHHYHHRHHHNNGHHHHHHHHHNNGHHEHAHSYGHVHHHATKQRHRAKHKSSSNIDIDGLQQTEKVSSAVEPDGSKGKDNSLKGKSLAKQDTADSAKSAAVAANDGGPGQANVSDIPTEMRAEIMDASGLKDAESDNKMLLDQEPNDATLVRTTKPSNNDEVVRMDMSPANESTNNQMGVIHRDTSDKTDRFGAVCLDQSSNRRAVTTTSLINQENTQPCEQQDSDLNTQGASGSDTNKRSSTTGHEFTRSLEGDSVKENRDKHNKFVRQASTPRDSGSQKEMGKADQQQQSSYSSAEQVSRNQRLSQPKQIIESSTLPDRSSKLSWCCCCPCSRSNSVSKSDTKAVVGVSNSNTNMCPTLPNIPLEEIRMWSDSFDRLMKCPDGRKVFQDFLRCEYSEENILFWIACEELKTEKDAKNIANKARDIYEDYISILSAKEVSLDSRVRDIINNNIKKPTSNIFDEAQLQIYTLMHRDSYPRFINSPMYKKLAQIQTSSRKGSS